jgi:hypothetical protein
LSGFDFYGVVLFVFTSPHQNFNPVVLYKQFVLLYMVFFKEAAVEVHDMDTLHYSGLLCFSDPFCSSLPIGLLILFTESMLWIIFTILTAEVARSL